MNKLHVLMTNHMDLKTMALVIRQMPFIIKHFDCLLVECAPNNVSNDALLKYFRDIQLTYELDLTPVKEQLGISEAHCLVLKNEYVGAISDEEKMLLKYLAVKEITRKSEGKLAGEINMVFYQLYYYQFLSLAFKNGMTLVGVEDRLYYPGRGLLQFNRDDAIVANTAEAVQKQKNCLMLVGASHGVDLIQAFQKHKSMINYYTHIYGDHYVIDPQAKSLLFKAEIEMGRFELAETQSYVYLDITQKTDLEQDTTFRERLLAMESNGLTYQEHGRTVVSDGSSFSKILSRKSQLTFFTTMHSKSYVADAVLNIENGEEKRAAVALKARIGLGDFFRTEGGREVFVIKNTNDPDPKRLEMLRDRLERISSP